MDFSPMLAKSSKPFDSKDFIFEVKYDGLRGILLYDEGEINLINRRGKDISKSFPELLNLKLNCKSAVLDGEIVVFVDGLTNFNKLQLRSHNSSNFKVKLLKKEYPATFVAFDIVELNGKNLSNLPLIKRKKFLEEVLIQNDNLLFSEFVETKGKLFFKKAIKIGFEGIIAKRKNSKYSHSRSSSWLKIKKSTTYDCVVCGVTTGSGYRNDTFGSLILGMYKQGKLRYVGRVGTGFDEKKINELYDLVKKLKSKKYPYSKKEEIDEEIKFWAKPEMVLEVKCLTLTKSGKLRHPSFVRIRDKDPKECVL